ncbi:MAG TPA: hypothetical protein VJA21_19235 [Verrucomicrobiae bacterium]
MGVSGSKYPARSRQRGDDLSAYSRAGIARPGAGPGHVLEPVRAGFGGSAHLFAAVGGLRSLGGSDRARHLYRDRSGGIFALLLRLPATIGPEALPKLKIASPLAALLGGRDYPCHTHPGEFWFALLAGQLMAWLFLAAASYGLRRSLRRESTTADRVEAARSVLAHRLRVGDSAPIAWLVQRQPGLKRALWIAATAMVLCPWTQFFLYRLGNWRLMAYYSAFNLICTLITSCLLAWVASRFFIQARRGGVLEALLATPVGAQTVLSAQFAGLRHLIRRPFLLMLASAVGLHFAYWVLDKSPPLLPPWSLQALVLLSLNLASLLLGLLTMAWVGLWFGLTARNQTSAILWTVGLADGAMGLVRFLATVVLHAYLKPSPPTQFSPLDWLASYGLTGVILLLRLGLMLYARRRVFQRINGQEPLR